jgi:branched-chain amino acid transport system permease protein
MMKTDSLPSSKPSNGVTSRFGSFFAPIPFLGWLVGFAVAVLLERWCGEPLADLLGLPKIPVLFGVLIMLKNPQLIPGAAAFLLLIYGIPVSVVGRITAGFTNRAAAALLKLPLGVTSLIHLLILYGVLHIWADLSPYRLLTLKLTLIAIILTLSLNVINGYMGEFSCSHPGFMALGAYGASAFTIFFFTDSKLFGAALFPTSAGIYFFPIGLIVGGFVASLGALIIAIPSFRTRGDYLAIISLAFMFIVKSVIENLEVLGGPRGMAGQPDWANLPMVFFWTAACIWTINNFVNSTMGKALNAIRDDESAADAMTVNTRRTKMVAFMFSAFWAGVAGGLFAHVIRFINPGTFGIQRLAEILAMTYFGGLNSVIGSIVGALSLNLLSEMLRPLELFKWIIIPLLLILVMIFRPTGLIAFREFDIRRVLEPKVR